MRSIKVRNRLNSSMTLIVSVRNVNDNPPIFSQSVFFTEVDENITLDKEIVQISATDLDLDSISYSFADNVYEDTFGLFGVTGWVYLRKKLDRETKDSYVFNVIAKDSGPNSKTATAQVNIRVRDINDNEPQFSQDLYMFEISENMDAGAFIGLITADDKDDGPNGNVKYTFTDPSVPFVIGPYDGRVTTRNRLDREARASYDLTVEASDQGTPPKIQSTQVKVVVKDINDNPPRVLNIEPIEVMVGENRQKGTDVVQIIAQDMDEKENGTMTFHLIDGKRHGKIS